ncbi:transposase [Streptomyces sp. NPDC059597]|uniref:transposase n=1 Tax=Streptomyces sp. NPDC059597 TaxID=3346879 RepID=UPI0036B51F94
MLKPYPQEFRQGVVRVARNRGPGVTVEQVAADFGVHAMTLWKWRRRADIDAGVKPGTRTRNRGRHVGGSSCWNRERGPAPGRGRAGVIRSRRSPHLDGDVVPGMIRPVLSSAAGGQPLDRAAKPGRSFEAAV